MNLIPLPVYTDVITEIVLNDPKALIMLAEYLEARGVKSSVPFREMSDGDLRLVIKQIYSVLRQQDNDRARLI